MEQSLFSLAFRGSIPEAIAEAKQQKKLFVVYTAGDNEESKHLETSTWINPKVSETLSKYCILLHILEGSSEASNFSAIYPQQHVPCITAVGYNGVKLWQKDGLVDADDLASNLEKAWLSLHLQETTATFLTAALASGNHTAPGTSENALAHQATPGTNDSASPRDGDTPSLDARQPLNSEVVKDVNSNEDACKDGDTKSKDASSPKPAVANVLDNDELDESFSRTETGNASADPVERVQNNPKVASPVPEKNLKFNDNHLSNSREITNEASQVAQDTMEVEKAEASNSSTVQSNDVFLNVRLPDGSSLQVKFSLMDTLRMVRDYINENQTSSLGSFSIAIPYPRKVFNDQDLDSTLSELGLSNRQALIVVPHKQSTSHYMGPPSQYQSYSSNEAASSNASEGYWASVKRILSYANIFSYLGKSDGSPSAAQESQSGLWQYSPNPSLQSTLRTGGGPSSPLSTEQSAPSAASGTNSNSNRRQQTSRFGGNIHTLKHDDDDDSRFKDRNAFWNGNSTQYGGNEDGK